MPVQEARYSDGFGGRDWEANRLQEAVNTLYQRWQEALEAEQDARDAYLKAEEHLQGYFARSAKIRELINDR